MTGRQLAAMETKKKLLAAAKRLIGERGLADVAVEEITGACGVAKGTFYTYFKKKEDIVFELSEEMFGEILENAKNAARRKNLKIICRIFPSVSKRAA